MESSDEEEKENISKTIAIYGALFVTSHSFFRKNREKLA